MTHYTSGLDILPTPISGVVGDFCQLTVNEWETYCNQYPVGPYNYTYSVNYACGNTSIATVNSTGGVTCMGSGNATITVSLDYYHLDNVTAEDCGLIPATLTVDCPVEVVSVTIENFTAVGKDQTADVQVTVTPSPIQSSITLVLGATSGTGVAKFNSNGFTTLNISQTTTVTIRGKTESSTADNMKLEAKLGSQSLGFRTFTVVKVDLSLRTGNSNSVSMDNAGRSAYSTNIGTTNLGLLFSAGTDDHAWRTGIEVVGTVTPNNFTGMITVKREVVAFKVYNNTTLNASGGPFDDQSPNDIRDDDPQSGGSGGKVYDLDAPGIGSESGTALNTILRIRTNFRQWAVLAGTNNRLSADLLWFSRVSIIKTSNGDQLRTDVTGDNVASSGTTLLSWNLQ